MGITEYGTIESTRTLAWALNGVAFQFANQIREDPVDPITATNEQPLDICLGHNQRNSPSGMYHYHDVSPCINTNFLNGKQMEECTSNAACTSDVVAWGLSGFSSSSGKQVIGLSKWGHVLYGPYDGSGALWTTQDVDACNGVWSANQNEYFYVSTRWHPYATGCQGPSNFPQKGTPPLYPQCSMNGINQYINGSTWTAPDPAPATRNQRKTNASNKAVIALNAVVVLLVCYLF